MKIIDLHEDIILTFEQQPALFFSDAKKEMMPEYNAGYFNDYKDRFELVFGAIRPYSCEGDMTDPHNRVITFTPDAIDKLLAGYTSWGSQMPLVKSRADLQKDGCKLLIHLEGHDTIGSVEELKALYDKGVRSFGRTWNSATTLSGSNVDETGLTPLGFEVLQAMNDRGMIVDMAHMSQQGMKDILTHSTKPVLNSHSNLYTLHKHTRNISDEVLDLLPKNGGVIGVSIYQPFITGEPEATMDMYLDQIAYIIDRIGDDHIALGTDWHGVPTHKTVTGLSDVTGVDILYPKMLERFGKETTEKFFHKNILRILEANLS